MPAHGNGEPARSDIVARRRRRAAIRYALADCALDRVLVAATPRGVCAVFFGDGDRALEAALAAEFPHAEPRRDDDAPAAAVAEIVARLEGAPADEDIPLDVRATAFQARVWRALCGIPRGETRSYADIAAQIGAPGAARAVGSACAANPASLLIPCHRAMRSDGGLGGYRWGIERKARLLAMERETGRPSPSRPMARGER